MEVPQILNVMERDDDESWIMDSGCRFHICQNKDWFEEIDETSGSVLLRNIQLCSIKGIGKIKFKIHDGSIKLLDRVRYIPEIKRNLIFLGMHESRGFSFSSKDGRLEVMKGSQVVMVAQRRSSLYYLVAKTMKGELNATVADSKNIWHMRLAHPGDGVLKDLGKKGLI